MKILFFSFLFILCSSTIFSNQSFSAEYTVISEVADLKLDGSPNPDWPYMQNFRTFRVLASGDLEYSSQNKILNKDGTWFDGMLIKAGPIPNATGKVFFYFDYCSSFDGVFEDISIKAGNYRACRIATDSETYGNSIKWYVDGVPLEVKSHYRFKSAFTVSEAVSIEIMN